MKPKILFFPPVFSSANKWCLWNKIIFKKSERSVVPSNEVHLLKYYFELLPFTLLHLFDTFISSSEVSDNSMKYNHQTGYFIMYYYQLKVQYVRFWLKTFKITKIINRI